MVVDLKKIDRLHPNRTTIDLRLCMTVFSLVWKMSQGTLEKKHGTRYLERRLRLNKKIEQKQEHLLRNLDP